MLDVNRSSLKFHMEKKDKAFWKKVCSARASSSSDNFCGKQPRSNQMNLAHWLSSKNPCMARSCSPSVSALSFSTHLQSEYCQEAQESGATRRKKGRTPGHLGHGAPFTNRTFPNKTANGNWHLVNMFFLVYHPTIKSDTLFLAFVRIGNCLSPEAGHWHQNIV